MKKILMSLLTIAIVGALVGGGVVAYFHDYETAEDNVFSAGIIDLVVDGENPLTGAQVELYDMKPCMYWETEVTLTRTPESNSGPVWMHIANIESWNEIWSEPGSTEINDIENWITFDLKIGDEVIIDLDDHIKLGDLECLWIPVGHLNAGPPKTITLTLSFHLQAETPNEYQGDACQFDLEYLLQQEGAPAPSPLLLMLENKPGWIPDQGDGRYGILAYSPASDEFEYDFIGRGLEAYTDYSLIYYGDPYPGNHPGALIASGSALGDGTLTLSSSIDLGMDLPDPADANYPGGAKIWLVLSDDYDGTKMTAWNWDEYLFEMHLITYDDTNWP